MNTKLLPFGSGSIIYMTRFSPDGIPLVGGVWKLYEQQGFPIEMSHLVCRHRGWSVDWCEAMADASLSSNCPALMKSIEAFLPSQEIEQIKFRFAQMVISGKSFEEILLEKRSNPKTQ